MTTSPAARKVAVAAVTRQPAPAAAAQIGARVPFGQVQLQPLRISSPHDPAEREAEATAALVMNSARPAAAGIRAGTARLAARQTRPPANLPKPPAVMPGADSAGGAPLPPVVRQFMEPRLGADLSPVRVHTDDRAAAAANQLNAKAFTVGPNVFFGRNQFQPDQAEGRRLLAHELTHTIQQGAVVQEQGPEAVQQRSGPAVQRLGLGDILDKLAEYANNIPGFRMFTIILGVNPINMSRVERCAANVMRAVIEFMPGGGLLTQALDNHGVFDKAAQWVDEQLRTLGMTGASIKNALMEFLDSLGWRDVFSPGDVWRRAKRIFTDPIDRIISFVKGIVVGILKLVKEAIVRPLAKLAEKTPAYDLLRAVLGQDPVTGDPYPRTPETVIGGFMKLIGQEDVWENMKKANAIPRAWAWFQGAVAGLVAFVRRIPGLFIQALTSLELMDIVVLPRAFAKVGKVFGGFVVEFVSWGLNAVWTLLEIIFAVVAPGVLEYLKKAGGAFRTILKNPIGFVGNLVRAGKLGFQQFAANIVKHLKTGLIDWLTGSLAGANIYVPQAFEIRELIKFVLSVLGLTWQNIRGKLVKVIGETAVKALETGFGIVVKLVTEGPAAAWEEIKKQLTNLKEIVLEEITGYVKSKVVEIAVTKLLSFLSPAGAIIQAIIAIYNTIMFFVERLKQIARVIAAFIDSIAAIASGAIAGAANRVETTLAGLLSLAISFLARFAGLGKVSDAITGVINKIRAPIDKAIDKVIEWVVSMARKAGNALVGAAKRVIAWWTTEYPITTGEASHTLSFQGEGAAARPMVASDPIPVEEFLAKKRTEVQGDAKKEAELNAAMAKLEVAKGLIKQAGQKEADEKLQKDIETAMNALAVHLKELMEEDKEWGTEANPVLLAYEKRRAAAYPTFYLAKGGDLTSLSQEELAKRSGETDYKSRIVRCQPTTRQASFEGEMEFGLDVASQIEVGRKLKFSEQTERKGGVGKFKDVVKKYGFTPSKSGWDVDHVVELQVGGQDVPGNLWPLPAGENRSSGAIIKSADVTLPGKKQKKMSQALEERKKQKGKSESLWMMVESTRQR